MAKRNATLVPPLVGTPGPDRLAARFDGDQVFGLGGADVLTSAFNRTLLDGGDGNDRLTTELSRSGGEEDRLEDLFATQRGGAGDDRMTVVVTANSEGGGTGAILNRLDGGAGNDQIRVEAYVDFYGGPGTNLVKGGDGHDSIDAIARGYDEDPATNRVDAGSGDDVVNLVARGGSDSSRTPGGLNEVWGRAGDDVVAALAHGGGNGAARAENILDGGAGHDRLEAIAETNSNIGFAIGINTLRGGAGDDILFAWQRDLGLNGGAQLSNLIFGGDGHDAMRARITTDHPGDTFGIRGLNQLSGGQGDDAIVAEARVQAMINAEATNDVRAGGGDDVVTASAEARLVDDSGSGSAVARNTLRGGAGDDFLIGEIVGANGRSVLIGGAGDDRMSAVGGTDNVLDGGFGSDQMRGSIGLDTFVVDVSELTAASHGRDEIAGFDPATDRLAFRGLEDQGAAGLVDDLALISAFEASNGDVQIAFGVPGERDAGLILRGVGVDLVDGFEDLVADPATQLILASDDLFA